MSGECDTWQACLRPARASLKLDQEMSIELGTAAEAC